MTENCGAWGIWPHLLYVRNDP